MPLTDSTVQMRYATARPEEQGLDCPLPGGLFEKHHGYAQIISREGLGTRFTIILPQNPQMGS